MGPKSSDNLCPFFNDYDPFGFGIDGGRQNLDAGRLQAGLAKLYFFEQCAQIVAFLGANRVLDGMDFHLDFVSHRYFFQELRRGCI